MGRWWFRHIDPVPQQVMFNGEAKHKKRFELGHPLKSITTKPLASS
jgi:hypothetical protein